MRFFETEQDRTREAEVARRIAPILGVNLIRTKPMCCVDYMVQDADGTATGLLEVRTRTYTAERLEELGGIFLSVSKLAAIYKVAKNLDMDFYYVVKTTNCLLHLCFGSGTTWPRLERTIGGRADKRYEQDVGPVYLFPTTMFTRIDDDIAPLPTGSP